MQVYYFTEQPYYPTWNNHSGSLRVNLPNKVVDPLTAGDLFHRYYDEWKAADALGYNIMNFPVFSARYIKIAPDSNTV